MSKSITIVGAGPGIAQAVAEKFGRQGWSVVLIARNANRLSATTAQLQAEGITVFALTADATRPDQIRAALAEAERLAGNLTVVHFNAAVVRQQDLFSMRDDEVENDLAINVAAGLHTIRAAVNIFGNAGGSILVTGGGLAITPHADYASLGIGKAALRNLVEGLSAPLAERGIRIGVATVAALVAPGSKEAADVADLLWTQATGPAAHWETVYPTPAADTDQLTLVARLTAKPDQAEALGEALQGLIEPTLTETGAIEYRLHRDNNDQNVWILYETWRSQADLDAHFAQPYTKAVLERFPALLARDMELTFPPRSLTARSSIAPNLDNERITIMKVWFITGASRGFGALVAAKALQQGDAVVATARNPKAVTDRIGEHPNLLPVALDVTDEAQAIAAAQAAIDRFGRIDVLLNNAGFGLMGAIEEATAA